MRSVLFSNSGILWHQKVTNRKTSFSWVSVTKKICEKKDTNPKNSTRIEEKQDWSCESKNSFLVWAGAMESWRFLTSSLELIESSIGECISGKLASLRFIIRERLPSHPRETFSTVKHEKNNAKWKGFGSAISSNRIALQIYSDRAQPKPILWYHCVIESCFFTWSNGCL